MNTDQPLPPFPQGYQHFVIAGRGGQFAVSGPFDGLSHWPGEVAWISAGPTLMTGHVDRATYAVAPDSEVARLNQIGDFAPPQMKPAPDKLAEAIDTHFMELIGTAEDTTTCPLLLALRQHVSVCAQAAAEIVSLRKQVKYRDEALDEVSNSLHGAIQLHVKRIRETAPKE